MSKQYIVFLLLVGCTLFFASSASVFSHGDEDHTDIFPKVEVCQHVSEQGKSGCYTEVCDAGATTLKCVEDIVDTSLVNEGTEFVTQVLYDLEKIPLFSPHIYEGAKRMGSVLALEYGIAADVFSQCPSDFRYGCIDGFFEAATIDVSPADVGNEVCKTAHGEMLVHCYHRIGHGIMKHSQHRYANALALCDSVAEGYKADCWDGVFMEGVHEQIDVGGVELFDSSNDVLAPCSVMDEHYREMCYRNHGLYLKHIYEGNTEEAIRECAGAGEYTEVCKKSVMEELHDHGSHADSHMGRAHDHHSGAMAGGESDSMSGSVADKERNSVINTVLIAYVIVFLLSIIFLVVSVKKKTGVFPITRNTQGVYGFVDKVVLLSYVLVIGNVVLYVMNEVSVYEFADILAVKIAGVVVAGIGLVCMFIAQRQMGKNWRVGIDQEHTTDIVDTGLFRYARHPIYLFAVVITIGMILVIPSISSIAILVLLWVALSVQARLEEEFFLEKHGEPYQRFMETRKRWFS